MGAAPEGEAEPAAAETDATTGEPAPDDGVAIGFQVGELAPVGLDRAALVQFATVQGDPKQGVFTLDEALAGLPRPKGDAQLWAIFEVKDRGAMQCRLFFEAAPDTVANFVGLARGIRPFRPPAVTPNVDDPASDWTTAPYYDGTTFHRVIPGFMIQGGDPSATGRGNPGFVVPDEIRSDLSHDVGGVLSMANRGPNTAGSQFFITLAPATNLDGSYTIFGRCTEDSVAVADNIAMVPRNADDKPDEPEVLERIRFEWR
jgi:peptidyl-prolyl cis-trans isomerase A (cyclophilin A)